MRKIIFLALCLLTLTASAFADQDGRTERGVLSRMAIVEGRGFGNVIGLPLEIFRTLKIEIGMHSRLWPVTYAPRLVTNLAIRASSILHDIVFLPVESIWTDDLSPWTEPMGLTDYPWQFEAH